MSAGRPTVCRIGLVAALPHSATGKVLKVARPATNGDPAG
jgi:hypothetical protein